MTATIYYDGDCPFCTRYVSYLRLKEAVGAPVLVNLREDAPARAALEAAGYDVDRGMVAEIDGARYWGDDAIHALSLLAGPSGFVNRLCAFLFSVPLAARVAYPLLRAGRCLTLDLLGRRPMADEDAQVEAKFRLFALLFGLFTVFHAIAYVFHYGRYPPSLDIVALFGMGAALVARPDSRRLFLATMALSLVSGWIQAPVESNHTLLRNYVALGFIAAYAVSLLRGTSWQRAFTDFSVIGGGGLVVMYFFGVFHKINEGFLDPAVSCAVELWVRMPPPLSYLRSDFIDLATIYSTLIVEGVILVALFIRRVRHIAIAAGILFHLLLALSGFSMYLPFTTLSIALHVLFLSPDASWRVMRSPMMAGFAERARQPLWLAVGFVYVMLLALLVLLDQFSLATLSASLFIAPLCLSILRHGAADEHRSAPGQRAGRAGRALAGAMTALLFVFCMLPYAGLKTGQSMNMFANLRLEGGVSNHLVFRDPPSLFGHLDDVAVLTDVSGSPHLASFAAPGIGIVYYHLLDALRRDPQATVSYALHGAEYRDQSAATLASEIQRLLYPPVVGKFLHFRKVVLDTPTRCI